MSSAAQRLRRPRGPAPVGGCRTLTASSPARGRGPVVASPLVETKLFTAQVRRRPPSTCGAPRNWVKQPGCRRTRTAGGSRWPASWMPKATTPAPSTCSKKRSMSSPATSPRTFAPSRRPEPGSSSSGEPDRGQCLGRPEGHFRRRRPLVRTRVRAHHLGPAPARPAPRRSLPSSAPTTVAPQSAEPGSSTCSRARPTVDGRVLQRLTADKNHQPSHHMW
jgi:hypothetical protein